jgi:hypothetical protein
VFVQCQLNNISAFELNEMRAFFTFVLDRMYSLSAEPQDASTTPAAAAAAAAAAAPPPPLRRLRRDD